MDGWTNRETRPKTIVAIQSLWAEVTNKLFSITSNNLEVLTPFLELVNQIATWQASKNKNSIIIQDLTTGLLLNSFFSNPQNTPNYLAIFYTM